MMQGNSKDPRPAGDGALNTLEQMAYQAFDDLSPSPDSDDERLQQRYTVIRRPHPLAQDRPVTDGIRLERRIICSLRDRADLVIDTSKLTTAELKRLSTGQFAVEAGGLRVFVTSFSYRQRMPREAEDARTAGAWTELSHRAFSQSDPAPPPPSGARLAAS
jgi:P-loop ATPase protein family